MEDRSFVCKYRHMKISMNFGKDIWAIYTAAETDTDSGADTVTGVGHGGQDTDTDFT